MTFSFSLGRFLVAASCLVAFPPGIRAQSPATRGGKSSSHAAAAPAALTHVRFWKTDLHDFPTLRVTLTPVGSTPRQRPTALDLGHGGPGYLFNYYAEAPAGRGTLEVFDAPGTTHPLVSLPVEFASGTFVTLLLKEPRKVGAPPQVEIIADGTEGEPDGLDTTAQIRVRSFVAAVKDIRLTVGDALSAQFTGNGSYLQMRGLKPAAYPVKTVGTGTDGKPFEWTTEADLRQHHSQTLLIFPDPYGRIRPRLSVDGEAPPPPDDGGQR